MWPDDVTRDCNSMAAWLAASVYTTKLCNWPTAWPWSVHRLIVHAQCWQYKTKAKTIRLSLALFYLLECGMHVHCSTTFAVTYNTKVSIWPTYPLATGFTLSNMRKIKFRLWATKGADSAVANCKCIHSVNCTTAVRCGQDICAAFL